MLGMFLLVLLSISFVNAFGIAVSYWEPNNQLKLQPGDSVDITFRLQNMASDDEDITLRAELIEGAEIATITDQSKEYFVPAGVEGVKTNIRVTIPESVPLGTTYKIAVSYTQIAEEGSQMVQLATKITQNIPVIVGEETIVLVEPEYILDEGISTNTKIILSILALLIIAAFIYFLRRRK